MTRLPFRTMLLESAGATSIAPRACARVATLFPMLALFVLAPAGCSQGDGAPDRPARSAIASVLTGAPDELPSMTNREPPFRYPSELYARRVQGNVTLRLFVDSVGTVVADSTRVEESSGHPALDSAAVKGSQDLRFNPARRRGNALAVSLLYPVYFRHPEAGPMPGDSVLQPR